MDADSTITRSSPFIPKASCFAAVLSVLPVLWLFLLVKPSDDVGPLAFCLSVALAAIALVLGLVGKVGPVDAHDGGDRARGDCDLPVGGREPRRGSRALVG